MKSFLEVYTEWAANIGLFPPGRAETVSLLLSHNKDAEEVRNWIKQHAGARGKRWIAIREGREKDLNCEPCEAWEAEIILLAGRFDNFYGLTQWEAAPNEQRTEHSRRVARFARKVADAMEEYVRPYYPPVLKLFDEEHAVSIIRALPVGLAKDLLDCTQFSEDGVPARFTAEGEPVYVSAASQLAGHFRLPETQEFPPLLRRLAIWVEEAAKESKRDKRPKKRPNARIFARDLAEYFAQYYGCIPYEVIAICVTLKFPELDSPPTAKDVRKWLGAKQIASTTSFSPSLK
jgi:hypothetical protein